MKKKIMPLDKFGAMLVDKEQAKTIAQVNAHTMDGSGRQTDGIFTKGSVQAATNGYELLVKRSDTPFPDEIQGVSIIDVEGRIIIHRDYDGKFDHFPDLTSVMPRKKPTFRISVDQLRLINLLSAMKDTHQVELVFYSDKEPFEIIASDNKSYALLMPMFRDVPLSRPDWVETIKPEDKTQKEALNGQK